MKLWSDRAGAGTARPLRWDALTGAAAEPAGNASVEPAASAAQRAAEIVAAARAEAEALREAAVVEAAAIRLRAEAEGRSAGYAAGEAAARADQAQAVARAHAALRQAQAERTAILEGLTAEVAELALTVARRVLDREVEQSPEEVVALAARLLRTARGPVTLHVHPEGAPMLEAHPELGGRAAVAVDASIAPGGLRLESEDGWVDASLEGRFARATAAIERGGSSAD